MKKKIFIIIITFISCVAWIDPFRDEVSDGNSKFHEKKFEDAQKHYKNAEEYAPGTKDKRKLSFNKGDAEYMQGNYERAIDHYRESLKSNDRDVQKKGILKYG
ncbi:MAG: tetratricopeptide repeat protein [bacterium]|nr:tetratricopeptide repeat protein [bacterium]